jgi:hypothetical protein
MCWRDEGEAPASESVMDEMGAVREGGETTRQRSSGEEELGEYD